MDQDRRPRGRQRRRAVYAVVLGVTLLGAGLGFAAYYDGAPMSLANDGDDGASSFHVDLEEWAARQGAPPPQPLAASYDSLPSEPDPTPNLVLLGPTHPLTGRAAIAVQTVLEDGGTVLLADDTGTVNPLLRELREAGLTNATFTGDLLIDLAYSRQPFFPVLHDVRPHPLTEGATPLVANGPTSIRPDPDATVLVRSSESSWLDRDGDGRPQPGDERGPHAVLSVETVPGGGTLILLSDPSILSNEMHDVESNGVLATNLARTLTIQGTPVYVDEVHRDHYPFALLADAVPAASTPTKVAVLGTLAALPVLGLAGLGTLRRGLDWIVRRTPQEDPVARALEDHPDWNRDRLEAVRHRLEQLAKEGPS